MHMKKYLLFPIFWGAALLLHAQNPPCYALVTVAGYENGVTTLTALDSAGFPATTYLWSTGESTSTIDVETDDTYCVTVTFSSGCTASDCYTVSNDSCSVTTYFWGAPGNNYEVHAYHAPGYMDAEYTWSNGQTGQPVILPEGGTYSVVATLENGCSATSTFTLPSVGMPCTLYPFQQDSAELGAVWLYAYMSQATSYIWSTGDSTSSIIATQPGTYCVTVTDVTGCSDSYCFTLDCGVDVEQNPAGGYTAYPTMGTPPYTFQWFPDSSTDQTLHPVNTGQYCVVVTDATGCTSTGCFYYYGICNTTITYNADNTLTAQGGGTEPFVYNWYPNGETTPTITPQTTGYYCVDVYDATGCVSSDCRYWYDSSACTVKILSGSDSSAQPGIWLWANVTGFDWHYLWSTGNNSSQLYVTAPGEYCVTVTNVLNGCTATACYWAQPDSACYVQIAGQPGDPQTWDLSAGAGPDPAVSYAWSTGATTPEIQVNAAGYYSVTVTNTAGCTVSNYYQLYENNSLIVQVQFPDSNASPGNGVHARLFLIRYDTAQGGILTAIDTIETHSWNTNWALGQFYDVPPGQYLVKAALLPGSTGYDNYLPTYYESDLIWNQATPVNFNALTLPGLNSQVSILMTPGQNAGGPGFIGGLVSEGANLTGSGGENKGLGEGDPFPGAGVVITRIDGTPVGVAVTPADGAYGFANLPWGTYLLTLDVPGLEPVSITVTIGPDQPSVTNVNFKVDENSVTLPTKDAVSEKTVRVFPNPAHDILRIELPAAAEITLLDTRGQTVRHSFEDSPLARLSVQDLPAGIYFLSARMAGRTEIFKVAIE